MLESFALKNANSVMKNAGLGVKYYSKYVSWSQNAGLGVKYYSKYVS